MGETVVYGGVEGGGTHSTVMIFDKVNILLTLNIGIFKYSNISLTLL